MTFRNITLLMATCAAAALCGCAYTRHAVAPSSLGVARSSDDLLAVLETPGPVTLETIDSAAWQVPLSGLLNLDHPKAKSAGLVDKSEDISVFFHVIKHPEHGTFLVDTGVEHAALDPERAAVKGIVADELRLSSTLKLKRSLQAYLAEEKVTLAGVFLTHLHLDHIWGMPDVPKGTPVYAGPGETTPAELLNIVVAPNIDRLLEGHTALHEWRYTADRGSEAFDGVVDIFGDGSVWAIWVPGHTPGNTAYLVRTTTGPVLLTGDTCHTRWGWDNGVEPGGYSLDATRSAASFQKLKAFATAHPSVEVRLGHQK